jgi:hypothetical protein
MDVVNTVMKISLLSDKFFLFFSENFLAFKGFSWQIFSSHDILSLPQAYLMFCASSVPFPAPCCPSFRFLEFLCKCPMFYVLCKCPSTTGTKMCQHNLIKHRKYSESVHISLIGHPVSQPSLDISPIWTPVITAEVKILQLRQVWIEWENL